MYDDELKRVNKKIKKYIKKGKLDKKSIYLFGVSENTRQIIKLLRGYNKDVKGIIDNDTLRQNSYCSLVKVYAVESHEIDKNNIYIIYSGFWREMYKQLIELGINQKNILVLIKKNMPLVAQLYDTYHGRSLYLNIINKYGNIPIFVCPYTGTGDIYLIGTFWTSYIKKYNITNYVFVVITAACKKVAELFGIKNIYLTSKKKEASYLISYYMLCPENANIKILNDSWPQIHINQIEWLRGYKKMYFTYLFKRYVFNLDDEIKPIHPQLKNEDRRIDEIFSENKLIYNKTVVLSPYSNTLADLHIKFWETLAFELCNLGYSVCTNSSGKDEPAIRGTIPIFFSLNIAPQLINKAGVFIGVRSGFCDIISSSKAKKIILYDKSNRFYNSTAYEYFNLKEMELCDDAIEIVYDNKNIDSLLKYILSIIRDV